MPRGDKPCLHLPGPNQEPAKRSGFGTELPQKRGLLRRGGAAADTTAELGCGSACHGKPPHVSYDPSGCRSVRGKIPALPAARSDRACTGDGSLPDSLDGFPAVPSNGLGFCCFIHTSVPASAGMVLPAESVWPSDSLAAGFGKPCLPSSLCAPLFRPVAEERCIKRQKGAERSCHCHHQTALLNLSAPY